MTILTDTTVMNRRRTATKTAAELPCRAAPQLFFAEDPQDVLRAKELCHRCPVRLSCLAEALGRREPCGVWGGELLERGAIIAGKRARGRPRKAGSMLRNPAA